MIGTKRLSHQQFLTASLLIFTASCGGGGGGGGGGSSTAAPVIVAASIANGGATPSAGTMLVLAYSRPVSLVPDQLLTDEDVDLSPNDTLGQVSATPQLLSPNSVGVILGAGVTLTLGSSTIRMGVGNDVVGGLDTAPRAGGDPVIIAASDGSAPTVNQVTIANIDDELNGTGLAGGTLQVPTNGWTIDLAYADNTAISTSQTVITADVAVAASSGPQPAGTNLTPLLTEVVATNSAATYRVPTTVQFPQTAVTLTAIVADVSGLSSTPSEFSFTVRPFSPLLQPFETTTNPSQLWFLDFSRDLESYDTSATSGGRSVDVIAGSNGTSDFEDLLAVVGLLSETPIGNVQGEADSNTVVLGRLKSEVLDSLATLHDGANISFTLTQPSGSFGTNASVAYDSLGYSAISIAGQSSTAGVLGLAIFDPSNTTQNNNTITSLSGTDERLGVFLHTIFDAGMGPPSSSNFRTTFGPFIPSLSGVPIGDDGQDGLRLLGTLSDARADEIDDALGSLARFIATVTAHECGHSVGLVTNGPMPVGLYGDDNVNFPGSANGHIRNVSLFPSGATNLMSPSLSFTSATSSATQFNTLNKAYLQEQVFYGN